MEGRRLKRKRERRARRKRRERLRRARERGTHTEEQWQALKAWSGGACVRCSREKYELEKDHIVPIYQGGSDGIDNLQPICPPCNASKGPETINWILREDDVEW